MVIEIRAYRCICERESCGHNWESRGHTIPLICPKCKSASWNKSNEVQELKEPVADDGNTPMANVAKQVPLEFKPDKYVKQSYGNDLVYDDMENIA